MKLKRLRFLWGSGAYKSGRSFEQMQQWRNLEEALLFAVGQGASLPRIGAVVGGMPQSD